MTAPTVLYLGTEAGVTVLRSQDGRKWDIESQSLRSWGIPKLTVDPSRPNRCIAGTRGDGVWVSEDFGQTWKKPSYGKRGPGKVRCITTDPHDPDTLYAGTEPIDIFVSHDLGKSWARLDSVWEVPSVESIGYPVPTVEPHVRDIAIDLKSPGTIYAALQVGYIIKSTDGGGSWRLPDQGLDCDVHTIVINPDNTDQVFIATGGGDSRGGRVQGKALYMSNDGGESWGPTGAEISQEYSVPLVMHPVDPKVLYSAVANGAPPRWQQRPTGAESSIIRTRDGGASWERLEAGLAELQQGFTEAIAIDPDDPDRLYAGLRSGGLFSSDCRPSAIMGHVRGVENPRV